MSVIERESVSASCQLFYNNGHLPGVRSWELGVSIPDSGRFSSRSGDSLHYVAFFSPRSDSLHWSTIERADSLHRSVSHFTNVKKAFDSLCLLLQVAPRAPGGVVEARGPIDM